MVNANAAVADFLIKSLLPVLLFIMVEY